MKNIRIRKFYARDYTLLCLVVNIFLTASIGEADSNKVLDTYTYIKGLDERMHTLNTDIGRFPTTTEGLDTLSIKPTGISGWKGPYLNRVIGQKKDEWGSDLIYIFPPRYGDQDFDLYSRGPNMIDEHGSGDDITNWNKVHDQSLFSKFMSWIDRLFH